MNQFAGFVGAAGVGACVIFTFGAPTGVGPGRMMPGILVLVDRVEWFGPWGVCLSAILKIS